MPYSDEDKWLIKHYREVYGWGSARILTEFGEGNNWSRGGIQKIIEKFEATGSVARLPGSGRPKSVCTAANAAEVEELIFSQENEDGEWERHDSPRMIARKIGISRTSVQRIIARDLDIKMYHRVKAQNLKLTDKEKRVERGNRLLRTVTPAILLRTFFSDEKIFTVEGVFNRQNDVVYSRAATKADVDEERIHHGKSAFPKALMVSAAVSTLGKTSLYIIDPGTKVNSVYYCDGILSELIPEMIDLSGGDFLFQQDGARSHTSAHTLRYLNDNIPATAALLPPEKWPPNSPDLNPMDYAIWSILETEVYKVKIRDLDHLEDRLGEAWAALPQEHVTSVVMSFRKRVRACIAAEGKRFEYKL